MLHLPGPARNHRPQAHCGSRGRRPGRALPGNPTPSCGGDGTRPRRRACRPPVGATHGADPQGFTGRIRGCQPGRHGPGSCRFRLRTCDGFHDGLGAGWSRRWFGCQGWRYRLVGDVHGSRRRTRGRGRSLGRVCHGLLDRLRVEPEQARKERTHRADGSRNARGRLGHSHSPPWQRDVMQPVSLRPAWAPPLPKQVHAVTSEAAPLDPVTPAMPSHLPPCSPPASTR